VAYTDKIYNAPLAARDDLPPALTASITEVFLSLNKTSRGQTVLKSLGEELTGYIEIDDSCYDGFRKSLQFEFETGKD
jgi:ABC-type phosphate/phosphonate transport system substrate-binding protein